MIYRELGRTGYHVSQLGFGAMRLPTVGEGRDARVDRELAIPLLHAAFEAGINYVDTAVDYINGDDQRAVGEALDGWRDRIIVSTKNPEYEDEKAWWENLEGSLTLLGVESIDLYNHHAIDWHRWATFVEPRVSKWMLKAKDQGLVRHICSSFHDENDKLRAFVDTGYPEVITLQYNMLDRRLEDGIAYAHQRGVGVVVMGPVAGGRLGTTNEIIRNLIPGVERIPDLALRFVLSNPHVAVALSGMSTRQMLCENLATTSGPATLSAEDYAAINAQLARLKAQADLYCTGCGYCQPCPQEVNIPHVFAKYNEARVYGMWAAAREAYAEWRYVAGKRANACIECGLCEDKCPQHIPVRAQLKEAHAALSATENAGSATEG